MQHQQDIAKLKKDLEEARRKSNEGAKFANEKDRFEISLRVLYIKL